MAKKILLLILIVAIISGYLYYGELRRKSGITEHTYGLTFNGTKAYLHVQEQCEIGPRPPGTIEHEKCVQYIVNIIKSYGLTCHLENFTFSDPEVGPISMVNIIVSLGRGNKILYVGAHYDTRPRADMEQAPENREKPILGANDGASGVAVLLELIRIFKDKDLKIEVRFIFFDGEDWGIILDHYFIGSRYHVKHLPANEKKKIIGLILLDMIGDKDLQIYMEGFSYRHARDLVELIWNTAKELNYTQYFVPRVKHTIYDDHYPFIQEGIPGVDIIDFDYPYWHTLNDTLDKVSPKSLEIVGRVVEAVILKISEAQGGYIYV